MTLGNLWQMVDRKRQVLMLAGTAMVLAGVVLAMSGFRGGADPFSSISSILPMAGGLIVFTTAPLGSRERVRMFRDWRLHPLGSKVLALSGLAMIVVYSVLWFGDVGGLRSPLSGFTGPYLGLTFAVLGWSILLMSIAVERRRITVGQAQPPSKGLA